ncbi:MAG: hypothetical protein ACYCXT_06615 [Acidiferrobacteraceae bacterium]
MRALKSRTIRILFATVCVGSLPVAAQASLNPFSGLRGCHEVSDQTLAHMRGRFVADGQVAYFGVEMQTVWTTAGGATLNSGVDFSIDLSHSKPQVGYSTTTNIVNPHNQTANGPPSGDAPSTLGQGVEQRIQVSSDNNTATNNVTVNVTNQGLVNPLGTGNRDSITSSNGMSAVASVTAGGDLVTEVQVPGEGEVKQVISNSNLAGGMLQNVLLSGPSNQVQNSLTVTLGVNPSAGRGVGGPVQFGNVLGTMMGVPRIGG